MNTFKSIMSWILILISVLGILVCSLAIAGSWAINNSLTQEILGLISRGETALTRVEDTLTLADAQLKNASATISTIQEAAAKLGDRVEKNSPVLDRITQILKDELEPTVTKIQDAFLRIDERVQSVNNTIEMLNRLPGIELATLDLQLDGPKEKVGLVADAVQQLRQNIADFRAGIVQSMAPFMEKIDTVAAFLTRLDQDVNTYLGQVQKLQTALANAKVNIPSTIDKMTIILSIVFLWLIIAQAGLILLARLYLRTGKMIWEINSPKKSQDVLPEPAA